MSILECGLRVGARLDGMGRGILPSSTQYGALSSPPVARHPTKTDTLAHRRKGSFFIVYCSGASSNLQARETSLSERRKSDTLTYAISRTRRNNLLDFFVPSLTHDQWMDHALAFRPPHYQPLNVGISGVSTLIEPVLCSKPMKLPSSVSRIPSWVRILCSLRKLF
ncbi:hypothetical protein Salat_2578200 [Sesamum alatum]|uniref:Uncharacterized protein n=1 Tax=Sesamum alatum TaxID=300844 RepID=A0AAE1XMS4_9LAMI|nr:hypothetical protein Salat_2578200 [Sesamum alatum]